MSCLHTDSHEDHTHGPDCGHTAIKHDGHIDYLVDGKLHHPHGDHCDQHVIEFDDAHPNECNHTHVCSDHVHGPVELV